MQDKKNGETRCETKKMGRGNPRPKKNGESRRKTKENGET